MSDGTPLPNRSEETPVSGRDYPEDDPEGRRWSEIWRTAVEELNANALVSDLSTNRGNYDPEDGTLYVPTDGGDWYLGTGTGWTNLGPIGDVGDHVSDTTNPHSVTASQADALSTSGGTVTGDTSFTTTTHDSVDAGEVNITSGTLWTEEGTVVGESVGIDDGDATPSGHPELCLWVDHGERTGWQITGSETYIDPFLPPDPSSTYTVSSWPMDEGTGTTAADADGDNDLTLNGPTWDTESGLGEGGAHLLFDGTDDTADGTGVPITGSTNRTIIAWINPVSTDSDLVLSSWGTIATGERWTFYTARATAGEGLRIELEGDGYTSSLVPQTNTWQMVAVILDGTTLGDHTLYLDGQTESASGTVTVNTGAENPIRFGNWHHTGDDRYYNGLCDSPVIFDRELSVELLDEYRAATVSRYEE